MKLLDTWETSIWVLNQYLLGNRFENMEELITDDLILYIWYKYIDNNPKLKEKILPCRWEYFENYSNYNDKMYSFNNVYCPNNGNIFINVNIDLDPKNKKGEKMKLLDEWEMSQWAYEQCLHGNNIEVIRNLITTDWYAYQYCRFIHDIPEVRKYVVGKMALRVLEQRRNRKIK